MQRWHTSVFSSPWYHSFSVSLFIALRCFFHSKPQNLILIFIVNKTFILIHLISFHTVIWNYCCWSMLQAAKGWELDSLPHSETFFNQEVKEYIECICTLTDCTLLHWQTVHLYTDRLYTCTLYTCTLTDCTLVHWQTVHVYTDRLYTCTLADCTLVHWQTVHLYTDRLYTCTLTECTHVHWQTVLMYTDF